MVVQVDTAIKTHFPNDWQQYFGRDFDVEVSSDEHDDDDAEGGGTHARVARAKGAEVGHEVHQLHAEGAKQREH